jgi:uncharacterized protein (DUF1330 family)
VALFGKQPNKPDVQSAASAHAFSKTSGFKESSMSAYVVLTREHTIDAEELARYAQKAPLAGEGRDISRLAFYGEFEVLEGEPIEGAAILRFADMATARQWYASPAYQEALQHRYKSGQYRVLLIAGTDPTPAPCPEETSL